MDERTFVEVYRAKNIPQAIVLQQALEEAGIAVTVENALLQGVVGELPSGWPTSPRIIVDSRDVPRALEILARAEELDSNDPTNTDKGYDESACLACGEHMSDDDQECPACGWSFADDEPEGDGDEAVADEP